VPQAATALFDSQQWPCHIVVGHLLSPRDQNRVLLQAVRDGSAWLVGPASALARLRPDAPRYALERLVMTADAARPAMRVAVIDDDVNAAESLCEWFDASDMAATPFTSAPAILNANPMQFDAFVVDFILTSGVDSRSLIEHIRMVKPHAPIALLTGHLRDGIEKPVRPGVLAAALHNSMDRMSRPLDGS
jgi:CheY-like chemotaxis protein